MATGLSRIDEVCPALRLAVIAPVLTPTTRTAAVQRKRQQ
jgi:hypothetical protein